MGGLIGNRIPGRVPEPRRASNDMAAPGGISLAGTHLAPSTDPATARQDGSSNTSTPRSSVVEPSESSPAVSALDIDDRYLTPLSRVASLSSLASSVPVSEATTATSLTVEAQSEQGDDEDRMGDYGGGGAREGTDERDAGVSQVSTPTETPKLARRELPDQEERDHQQGGGGDDDARETPMKVGASKVIENDADVEDLIRRTSEMGTTAGDDEPLGVEDADMTGPIEALHPHTGSSGLPALSITPEPAAAAATPMLNQSRTVVDPETRLPTSIETSSTPPTGGSDQIRAQSVDSTDPTALQLTQGETELPGGESSQGGDGPLTTDITDASSQRRFVAAEQRHPGKTHVVLISTGSVASIKVPMIVEALQADGRFAVQVVATKASLNFYDPSNVGTQVWTDDQDWTSWKQIGDPILHIELRRWADIVLVAPCSADMLAKIANGICDSLATSLLRALSPETPTYLFPAMNTMMWQHPLTAHQVKTVKDVIGYIVVGPQSGKKLACGDEGPGAMTDWREIVEIVRVRALATPPQAVPRGSASSAPPSAEESGRSSPAIDPSVARSFPSAPTDDVDSDRIHVKVTLSPQLKRASSGAASKPPKDRSSPRALWESDDEDDGGASGWAKVSRPTKM